MASEGQRQDIEGKVAVVAQILEGRAVDDSRVDICIKGVTMGFPASLEAFQSGFPFGVTYFVETKVIDDPAQPADSDPLKLVFTPRVVSGFMAKFLRHFLFESKGMELEDPQLDKHFICQFSDAEEAHRFARYPGISEKIVSLHKCSNFNELIVKTDAGVLLTQSTPFEKLDVDVCRATFKLMAEIGQVVFEVFS